ncbi:MAG: glutamate--tRNA ligase [Planctomycetales bacterium]|nr:glutamate--tRNA ligase [Planctomycetales bacterium]
MVRTRFAPSPTGYLHIGGVRTALFNWLFARQHGGQFLLRIDDTDQQRNVAEALKPILDGFKWLGIDWDEGPTDDGQDSRGPHGPYFQSQRSDKYQAAVDRLLASGHAYRDFATAEEVAAERTDAEQEKRPFVYSRTWMAADDAQAKQFADEGRQSVVRLKMPREGACEFVDHVRGPMSIQWASEQDHVVQRADGSFIYHLASVVDDQDMQITHVIRAAEHLSNTPRQIFIAQALGYPLPEYAHVPVVNEPGGNAKLSKRKLDKYLKNAEFKKLVEHGEAIAERMRLATNPDTFNPVVVDFYREVGYLPDAIINYILLLGWSLDDKTEDFTREEMIQHFSLARVNKAPASFDPAKLWAFQQRHMQRHDLKKKVALVLPYLQAAGWVADPPPCEISDKLRRICQAIGDRLIVAGDILDYAEFFVADDALEYDEKAFEKRIAAGNAKELLARLKDKLAGLETFDAAATEAAVKAFVEAEGIKIGDIIHALRVAVTGKAVGVGMFDSLEIVGREGCVARIDQVITRR